MTLAWHFVGTTLRDGRPVPADAVTLVHDGALVLCESGLHASERLLDAVDYAPGNILCRVRMGGELLRGGDKMVARERTILWRIDAKSTFREFARRRALSLAHLWDMPDVVREYLTGNGSEWFTAYDAAMDAMRAATAARDAAWANAAVNRNPGASLHDAHVHTRAFEAAFVAATAADLNQNARHAARSAALYGGRDASEQLTAMVYEAAGREPEADA